jgi:hypothetical protein
LLNDKGGVYLKGVETGRGRVAQQQERVGNMVGTFRRPQIFISSNSFHLLIVYYVPGPV